MTDTTDTSAEAVERLRKLIAMHGDDADAATLRALLARAEKAEAERDEARGYLSRLLQSMHPTVEPLTDLHGVCTQIDNAIVGLLAERDRLREALRLAEKAMRSAQSYGSDKAQAFADLAYQTVVAALKETGHD